MMSTTFTAATAQRDALSYEVTRLAVVVAAIPGVGSGPMGLTPDAVRATPAYREGAAVYAVAFAKLRRFNAGYVKAFKVELRNARRARDASRAVAS